MPNRGANLTAFLGSQALRHVVTFAKYRNQSTRVSILCKKETIAYRTRPGSDVQGELTREETLFVWISSL